MIRVMILFFYERKKSMQPNTGFLYLIGCKEHENNRILKLISKGVFEWES